jgi:phosphoglycolate phosphatase
MKAALFWDIDGTLLTTARAGVFALQDALREIVGVDHDLQALETAGLTDAEVVALCLREAGCPDDAETVTRFLGVYEQHLPHALPRRDGRVLEGVVELLEDLAPRGDIALYLLTGNTRAGAAAKLEHYGLLRYFRSGGAFCDGPGDREGIARRARALADGAPLLYVIGDTPHDIRCGKAIGARTVALATGPYTQDRLAAAQPWLLLEQLPEPAEFRRLLELD